MLDRSCRCHHLELLFVGGGAGFGEGAGVGAGEIFFAEGEAEDDLVDELDGEGGAFFELGGFDLFADLGAEGVAVLGLAVGDGKVRQQDAGPLVEGDERAVEAEAEVVLDEFDGGEFLAFEGADVH